MKAEIVTKIFNLWYAQIEFKNVRKVKCFFIQGVDNISSMETNKKKSIEVFFIFLET